MSQPRSDRHLRRLIAEMSAFTAGDIQAILSELGPADRDRIEALLREYAEPSLVPAGQDTFDSDALSPWLAERVSSHTDLPMTPRAIEAIQACAVRLFPIRANTAASHRARVSLIGRISCVFARRVSS